MEKPQITFATNVWEGDWKFVLRTGRLKKIIDSCKWDFEERVLYINNVSDREKVAKAAQKHIDKGVITSFIFVDDSAAQTLEYFHMDKDSFKGGYYYSIQELTAVLRCKTKYLLHLTCDTVIQGPESWIMDAINYMEKDPSILTAQPLGDPGDVLAKGNLVSEDALFYRCFGFSDQCYLIRPEDFRKPIYNETNEASSRYPSYAGELFEKRIDSYMRNHGKYKIASKITKYKHQNFPKDPVRKWLLYFTGINLKKGR